VHGRSVVVLETPPRRGEDRLAGEGDALLTREPGRLVAVASADCVPILLCDPASGWIAAVHAGWRGTAARILDAVLDALEARGVAPAELAAFFGPSISRERYEVGPEVVEVVGALSRAYQDVDVPADALRRGTGDRSWIDVAAFDRALLAARGVRSIGPPGPCTAEDPGRFPSYRRDGARTGRVMTGIVRL
jgi:YfiH family protein